MAGVTLATEAVLLTRRDSGEHGVLLTLLAPDHGLITAFKRVSTRGRQPLPDLFDEAILSLEKGKGGDLWFVTEYLIQRRRPAVGAHYKTLLYACRYALLLSHHLFEAKEAALWIGQLRQALDAWESSPRPEATYFKALYLFARLQGIPVKEEWLKESEKAASAIAVLREPLAGQTTSREEIERLVAEFENYLHQRYDVRFES